MASLSRSSSSSLSASSLALLVGDDGSRHVIVSVKREKVLRLFGGLMLLYCAGSLKDAIKVHVTREASRSAHSSSEGSQRGAPAKGDGWCRFASLRVVRC